jgi:hypothetical protein
MQATQMRTVQILAGADLHKQYVVAGWEWSPFPQSNRWTVTAVQSTSRNFDACSHEDTARSARRAHGLPCDALQCTPLIMLRILAWIPPARRAEQSGRLCDANELPLLPM